MDFARDIFRITEESLFNELSLRLFRHQFNENRIYRGYAGAIEIDPEKILSVQEIPFLPISFFKTHTVLCGNDHIEKTFLSSGTTGSERSRHQIQDLNIYRESLVRGFEIAYGPLENYDFLALTPSPEEYPDSSLIFMISEWIRGSGSMVSGFYLNDFSRLAKIVTDVKVSPRKKILIGLSYALLDFASLYPCCAGETIIIETGGMKGKRKEMIREELHTRLKQNLGVPVIHSEYGMTELLSQAYSKGEGRFTCPPWMKVLVRDPNDPLQLLGFGKTGCLNIIDLANVHSCSFIATEDLGKVYPDGSFEVLGRFDPGMVRGCNLMVG